MSIFAAPTLAHYLVLGAILFAISIAGIFLNRRNVIIVLMAIELMLLAVNLNFIAFSRYLGDMAGQVVVFFLLPLSAAQSAIGPSLPVLAFRDAGGRRQVLDRLPDRSADRDDDARRVVRLADGPRLYDRLHGRRSGIHAVLRLHLALYVLDADARDEQQLPPALLRLGSGGARV